MRDGWTFGRSYFYDKPYASSAYLNILNRSISESARKYVIIACMVIVSASAAAVGPIYDYLFLGKHSTFVGGKLPYFEENSYVEFVILSIYEMLIGSYAILGNIGIEVVNALSMDMINVFVKTTNLKKDNFTRLLRSGKASERDIQRIFRSIVKAIEAVNE